MAKTSKSPGATRRSNVIILVGLLVFLIGGAGVLIVMGRGGQAAPSHLAAQAPAAAPQTAAAPTASATTASGTSTPIGATSLHIPAGLVAVSVQVSALAGVNGYPVPGDQVDLFGTFQKVQPTGVALKVPFIKLMVPNVTVLAVNEPAPASSATGATSVLTVAVSPSNAERLIYGASFESLYAALVPAHEAPAATPGRDSQSILASS